MAKTTNRLSALDVKRLVKPGMHGDGGNLYLSVSESGAKSWRIIYTRDGNRTELGIGSLAGVTLADAREKAAEARRLLAQGVDLKKEWQQAKEPRQEHTFGSVALELIEDLRPGWKNRKHGAQWENTLRTYAAAIWDKAPADIDVEDVLKILRPIWNTKTETAQRVRGRIEAVLSAAKVRRLRSGENPAVWRGNLDLLLARRRKGPKRHHPAMPYAEVPAFMARLRDRPALAARALELTILTAARTSEVLQARRDEFDLDVAMWVVPAERMKAGKQHRVALSKPASDLVRNLQGDDEYLFPGLNPGKPLSNMAMEMVLRRMDASHYTVHGFRSSFRDWVSEATNFPRELAELTLAHAVGSEVERAYRRGDAFEKRRQLMEKWSQFIAERPQGR